MPTGVVKWFNEKKGFGFITPSDSGKDVFVHYSAIKDDGYKTLAAGEAVEYNFIQGPRGLQATEVIKI